MPERFVFTGRFGIYAVIFFEVVHSTWKRFQTVTLAIDESIALSDTAFFSFFCLLYIA